MALLMGILTYFTLFFFKNVISHNGVEMIKQYLIDVALVDPSVADMIKTARNNCNGQFSTDSSTSLTSNSMAQYSVYALFVISGVFLFLHLRARFMDKKTLFSNNEFLSLAFLLIPIVIELILYYFVYQKYKFYSNVYLIKLMKNLRIRADLTYLTTLYSKRAKDIDTTQGECYGNCLDETQRAQIMQNLNDALKLYNNTLDGGPDSECSKIKPSSIWARVSKLPGILGVILTAITMAYIARATYELNDHNTTVILSVIGAVFIYIIFLYLLHDYASSGSFKTLASFDSLSKLFCVTESDFLSKLLKRNLSGVDTQKELDALK